jgi:glycosyltransferase family protein
MSQVDKIKNAFNLHYGIVFKIPRKIAKPILSLFFPLVKLIWPLPNVKTIEETILELKNSKKSIARFGDGEIQFIVHKLNLKYQEYDENLANKLEHILKTDYENLLVGLPDGYRSIIEIEPDLKIYWRAMIVLYYPGFYKYLAHKKQYYNANITRLYYGYVDKVKCAYHFELVRSLWDDKNIVLVEGEKSRLGAGNDLFNNAKVLKRILAPAHHAYRQIDNLFNETCKYPKDYLILVALGTTAKALVFDLMNEGYQAIDIGNLDLEYEWFKRGVKERILIPGKYVSEVKGGRVVAEISDPLYHSQIVAKFTEI